MLTSPLYAQNATVKPDAMVVQEREVSAQYTQADLKESLRSHSSEGQKALEKPNALLSSEQGNLTRSSAVFRNANSSNLMDLSLKVTRITCPIRQGQTWRSKNFMSSPSMSASVNYNDKRKSKDEHCRTHTTDLLNQDENKFDYEKSSLWKKKFTEILKSEIFTKWEKERGRKNFE